MVYQSDKTIDGKRLVHVARLEYKRGDTRQGMAKKRDSLLKSMLEKFPKLDYIMMHDFSDGSCDKKYRYTKSDIQSIVGFIDD